jgi:hypothetical protein
VCGAAQLADSESATDWGGTGPNNALPFYGVTYQAAGPLGSQAITTDGSTGWAETTTEYSNPENFTVLMWLKTTTASGAILGFSSSQDPIASAPNAADRLLWVDSTGKLVWALYNGATEEITSPSAVNTGSWVFVAASVGAAGTALYVNGSKVVSSAAYTTASSYLGWWSIGWAYFSSWPDSPTGNYFNGSLAQLAIIPSQLTTAQVSTIYGESTPSAYATEINTFSPASYWPLNDTGSVPYTGNVPGTESLVDSSGHGNTGTALGGVTLGASGPTTLGTSSAISLNGSSGWVETTNSYADPTGFSVVAWFKTTTTSGGTIIGFDNLQNNSNPGQSDRLLWMDNTGHLVWALYNGGNYEITTPAVYNTGAWVFVVAEVGSLGAELYVNGTEVVSNSSYTAGQNYTGYWHIGWGYVSGWSDAPTSGYLNGSESEVAVVPTQLTSANISTLYGETSTSAFSTYMIARSPTSYWALQDSTTTVCGTTEITVQDTVGATNTCIYPVEAVGTACPALSSTYLLTGLGTRSSSVVTTLWVPRHRHDQDGALGRVGVRRQGPPLTVGHSVRHEHLLDAVVGWDLLPLRVSRAVTGGMIMTATLLMTQTHSPPIGGTELAEAPPRARGEQHTERQCPLGEQHTERQCPRILPLVVLGAVVPGRGGRVGAGASPAGGCS